jgi:hypothetical protein
VRGGVRSPFVDVPTSTWSGNSTGPSFCRIAGHEVPLAPSRLKSLYPTHSTYVSAVKRNIAQLVARRLIVKEDGAALLKDAEAAAVR